MGISVVITGKYTLCEYRHCPKRLIGNGIGTHDEKVKSTGGPIDGDIFYKLSTVNP